jgi:hypothetical protein
LFHKSRREGKMKKIFSSVVLLVMLLAVTMTPVFAAGPTVEVVPYWPSPSITIHCGDFSIDIASWSSVKITTYWNKDGSLNRYHVHGESFETYTTTTGKTFYGSEQGFNLFGDATTTKLAGLLYHLVVPGNGTILIDAGYVYADPTGWVMHGNHPVNWYWFTGEENFIRLCEAFR